MIYCIFTPGCCFTLIGDTKQQSGNILFIVSFALSFLLGQPGAVNNLPAVASKTQLMGLMNQSTITLAKGRHALRGGGGHLSVHKDEHD